MANKSPMLINCGPHGERIATVVCQHLLGTTKPSPAGFVENSSEPDDLQAWCHACEDRFLAEGEMTAAFREFNGMSIVCSECYEEIKAQHLIPAGQ
jgi:hypothetical protein